MMASFGWFRVAGCVFRVSFVLDNQEPTRNPKLETRNNPSNQPDLRDYVNVR